MAQAMGHKKDQKEQPLINHKHNQQQQPLINHKHNQQQQPPMKQEQFFEFKEIDQKTMDETKQKFLAQCPSMKFNEHNQKSLLILLSYEEQNKYPILPHLISSYCRDKLEHFLKNERVKNGKKPKLNLELKDWIKNHQTVKNLLSNCQDPEKQGIEDNIKSGIDTYLNRYCSPMHFPFTIKIKDEIEAFVHCLRETSGLIQTILRKQEQSTPFQIDLVIIPRDIVDITEQNDSDSDSDGDDDSDEFDDDEFDDEEEDEDDVKEDVHKIPENIGDIEDKLKGYPTNIVYQHKVKQSDDMFREFRGLLAKYETESKRKIGNKRITIVVDRRNRNKGGKNKIFMLEPPEFNEIPHGCVKEWYFESSYNMIIPDKAKSKIIKSKTAENGWINIFSFHVEQEDEISCFLYKDGDVMRFMPDDVDKLLPKMFEMDDTNKKYMQRKNHYMDDDEEDPLLKWKDAKFDKFRGLQWKKLK